MHTCWVDVSCSDWLFNSDALASSDINMSFDCTELFRLKVSLSDISSNDTDLL